MAKLWGGRFKKGLAPLAKEYSYSLAVDQVLFPYDIALSIAHAKTLAKAKLLSSSEAKKIEEGLLAVEKKFGGVDLTRFASEYEDVHSFIQAKLSSEIGEAARKLHTARSRNDEVATATRLYLKDKMQQLQGAVRALQKALVQFATVNKSVVIPGYTHLQRAQPVLLAHHILAYVEMLERDHERFKEALARLDVLPLGSGSLAGSTLVLDRKFTAKLLGFKTISENSMDAVSDRDFVVEVLAVCAILVMHLSRFSEDLILWNTAEFGYIELSDEFTTGSSLMPQKKNPDILELSRGRTGDVYGNLVTVLVMLKGLPLAYNRDMQGDKKPLVDSVEGTLSTLKVLEGLVTTAKINKERCDMAARDSRLYATDLLDYLVMKGMSFRDAHELVGRLVLFAESQGKEINQLSLTDYQKHSSLFAEDVFSVFEPTHSVDAKNSIGATATEQVHGQLQLWKKRLS